MPTISPLLLATPFLIVLGAGPRLRKDNRPPLFFREDWKEIAAVTPVTQEHVANPALLLGLYGPGKTVSGKSSRHAQGRPVLHLAWVVSANCAMRSAAKTRSWT